MDSVSISPQKCWYRYLISFFLGCLIGIPLSYWRCELHHSTIADSDFVITMMITALIYLIIDAFIRTKIHKTPIRIIVSPESLEIVLLPLPFRKRNSLVFDHSEVVVIQDNYKLIYGDASHITIETNFRRKYYLNSFFWPVDKQKEVCQLVKKYSDIDLQIYNPGRPGHYYD